MRALAREEAGWTFVSRSAAAARSRSKCLGRSLRGAVIWHAHGRDATLQRPVTEPKHVAQDRLRGL